MRRLGEVFYALTGINILLATSFFHQTPTFALPIQFWVSQAMIKKLIFAFAICVAGNTYAQSQETPPPMQKLGSEPGSEAKQSTDGMVFQFVEQMPSPGFNMNEYLGKHIKYPGKARRQNIQGRVLVAFVVTETGAIEDVKVTKGVCPSIDKEAIRVIKKMPNWKPGKQNGKAVKVRYTQPISFKLE